MNSDPLARYAAKLKSLERRRHLRTLSDHRGADFSSNDYLGLAASPSIRKALINALKNGLATGAGGSRLLRGNHSEHALLEAEAASHFHAPSMLYFSNGYAANLAVLSTLPQRDDLIVYDALIHASAHEGMRTGKAETVSIPHNDAEAFDKAIRIWRNKGGSGTPWIVVESLYSMDGDCAPLSDLVEIADRHDAFLFIDEAHATGVHGPGGRGFAAGLESRPNVIALHTCGKAIGSAGGLVAADPILRNFLVNRARPFIYSTAPSPLQVSATRLALKTTIAEQHRRHELHRLIAFANARFADLFGSPGSGTQILPLIVGDADRTLRIAHRLQAEGFDIRAIRQPTVPSGTARLRITITLNVDESTITRMFERLAAIMAEKMI
ncbi:8-amino-7-oxononanoate synthase [Ochrobactrum sp. POC9]|uniref:8-amino-7-oxononanoate synthase n=1 Tax=unclassified Ochrobactrum TaxID=239106 RepID=UPI000D706015|nr:8-amino-7-oxononanoate synthase [Ochrobactrum sp. POC9]MCH4543374.1 8-amino-7-oxononanoate synthase [Ochrobactrum sp. A-1]PWU75560.1 8-amino-7-oxononanoate synthase [Ochrobactrum sp. POC9]